MKKFFFLSFSLIIIVFIFTFVFAYLIINSVNITYNITDKNIIELVERVVNNSKMRNNKNGNFFDILLQKFYTNILISEEESLENNRENAFIVKKYYAVVDLTDDIFFIKKDDDLKDIKFLPISELNLYKRVLLYEDSGKPVIKNKIIYYQIKKKFFSFLNNNKIETLVSNFKFFSQKERELFILGFAGDFTFEYYLKREIEKNGTKETFKQISHILNVPDIMSVNLECVISNSDKREAKRYTFKGTEEEFMVFENSGIDYFACANNHAMDFGEESLLDTIAILDKYNYKHSGTGKNIKEAISPAIINLENIRLAFFSIAEVPTEMKGYEVMKHFTATEIKSGIANYNKRLLAQNIKEQKDKGGIVIVQFHTGSEHYLEPLFYTKKMVQEIIDMGADAVICHHPHVINGVEIYKDRLISYSLGDFLLYIINEFADEGIILYLFVNEKGVMSFSFYPTACYYGKFNMSKEKIYQVGKRFIELTKRLVEK